MFLEMISLYSSVMRIELNTIPTTAGSVVLSMVASMVLQMVASKVLPMVETMVASLMLSLSPKER